MLKSVPPSPEEGPDTSPRLVLVVAFLFVHLLVTQRDGPTQSSPGHPLLLKPMGSSPCQYEEQETSK